MNPTRKPALLSEAGAHSELIVRPFLEAGFEVDRCRLDELAARLDSGQYNVVVLGKYYLLRHTKQEEARVWEEVRPALHRFLERGGGILYSYPSGGVGPYREVLREFGAEFREVWVCDPETGVYPGPGDRGREYAYTTRVLPPVDEDVRGIWYVTLWGSSQGTRPVLAPEEDGWQVVLRGSPASHAEPMPQDYGTLYAETDTTGLESSVPLMAIKDFGPGRMAVLGIPSGYHFAAPHTFELGRRFLVEGFHHKPSDMVQLLLNTARWLAEPSLESGALGGATSPPTALRPDVAIFPDDPPVKWAERDFPPDGEPLRGLIGARTAYSTGSGTVAEYVAKAQAAGLDFLVFLEDFKALDQDKLDALKRDCEEHTTDTFFAVPGLTLEDCAGNHTFHYGYQIALPSPDLLSADGQVLANTPDGEPYRNNRLDVVHSVYMFVDLKCRCRNGTYLHAQNPMRTLDLRVCDSLALVTWEQGQVLDDACAEYRALEDLGMLLIPTVLTFMNSPAELDAALASGWRNLILEPYAQLKDRVLVRNMGRELEWWGYLDEEVNNHPRHRFNNWQNGWPFQYMTSGPEIRAWAASASGRDPVWRAPDTDLVDCADWFRADQTGFRLRLRVTSEVGLEEICLYEGERLVRRWQPAGAREFEQELDLVNSQQLNLSLQARDLQGGVAISQDFYTQRLDWCEFFCADRNNQLTVGYGKAPDSTAYGWSGTMYLTYSNGDWGGQTPTSGRWWIFGDALQPVPRDPVNDETNPCDGGVTAAGAGLHMNVVFPREVSPPELALVHAPERLLISADVAIGGTTVEQACDPAFLERMGMGDAPAQTGWSWFPVVDSRYLRLQRRGWAFRPRPYALTTTLREWELSWRQDPGITGPLQVAWLDPGATHVLYRADGGRETLAGSGSEVLDEPWDPGEYLISWTDGARPALFLNQGVPLRLQRSDEGTLAAFLAPEHQPTADRSVTLRMIGIGGTVHHRDPEVGEKALAAMGLRGAPAYQVTIEQGELLSQELFLRLAAGQQGVALTLPQADLPMDLPVLLEQVNENWPVFLVDRAARRWRPLGVLEGTAYATLDTTAQDWNLYLGHPVTASVPAIVLSLTQISPEEWVLEVHNPTAEEQRVQVTPSPYFDLLDWSGEEYLLAAGESRFQTLPAR